MSWLTTGVGIIAVLLLGSGICDYLGEDRNEPEVYQGSVVKALVSGKLI